MILDETYLFLKAAGRVPTHAAFSTDWTCSGKVESSLEVKGELDDEAATVHEGI